MIRLENVTRQNVDQIRSLRVREDQRGFVADNSSSLIDACIAMAEGEAVFPFAVCEEETVVGFVMIGFDTNEDGSPKVAEGSYSLWRLMIDERYQNRGYGRQAMEQAMEFIRSKPCGPAQNCWLSYEPENTRARALYEAFGFRENGETACGESVAVLAL